LQDRQDEAVIAIKRFDHTIRIGTSILPVPVHQPRADHPAAAARMDGALEPV